MAKMTINGQTFEGSVDELVELSVKMDAKGSSDLYIRTSGEIRVTGTAREALYLPVRASEVSETITHEGVEYKRVDREAREGDVVVFDKSDNPEWLIVGGKPYEVAGKSCTGRETFIGEDGVDYHVYNDMTTNRTPANVKVYEPIVAKPAPLQVGDYAKVVKVADPMVGFEVGDIGEIIDTKTHGIHPVAIKSENGIVGYGSEGVHLVRATDEEVAEAKRQAEFQRKDRAIRERWADIGREAAEFKKGDIVRVVGGSVYSVGTIGEVTELINSGKLFRVEADGRLRGNFHDSDDVELITPVEHRFDQPAGDSE